MLNLRKMVSWWGRRLGVQIGKQKPVIIHTEFFLFFNTGSCFTNGAVIHMNWRQIVSKQWPFGGCKGDQMISQSLQFFDFISIRESKTDLAPNWPAIRTWIGREFGRESKTVLTVNSAVKSKTWVPFNGHFRPQIRPWIEDRLGQKFKTLLPFNLVEIYFECFICVSGLSAQMTWTKPWRPGWNPNKISANRFEEIHDFC